MRKTIHAALAAAVVAATLIGTAGAFASAPAGRVTTLQYTAHFTHAAIVDAGKSGPSAGDQQVVVGTLSQGAKTVGRFGFICEFLTAGPHASEQCDGTGRVAGGTLTLQGYSNVASEDHRWAVVGGTGTYRGARGQALIHDVNQTTATATLELVS
jgi:Dirigent-like protein